jgi:hypothetical protein
MAASNGSAKNIIWQRRTSPGMTFSIHIASSEHLASGCRSQAGLFD